MSTVQVRISANTHTVIRSIAKEIGESMQNVVERAVERYRRELFLESLNRDFEALQRNRSEWKDEIDEREIWDVTLADGQTETR